VSFLFIKMAEFSSREKLNVRVGSSLDKLL
jgi:hypothetical protein